MEKNLQSITVNAAEYTVRLGCSAEERAFPQKVKVDLKIGYDISKCVLSDDIADAVNYLPIVQSVGALLADGEWRMIEKLAWDIGQHVLAADSRIEKISVRATKNILSGVEGFSAKVSCKRERD